MKINTLYYKHTNTNIWIGRKDTSQKTRCFEYIYPINLKINTEIPKCNIIILGFYTDEGIKRNKGIIGAKTAPYFIRKSLANLCMQHNQKKKIYDLGNIICYKNKLHYTQNITEKILKISFQHNIKTILLGGGHEITWPHYQAINNTYKNKKIGIINLDAHYDLRPNITNNFSTSGTSFYQIYQNMKNKYYYQIIGMQPSANTMSLHQLSQYININVISAQDIYIKPKHIIFNKINNFLNSIDYIYISICLDVYASYIISNTSAPQAIGLSTQQIIHILQYIIKYKKKIIAIDIAELSPKLTKQNQSANIAAQLILSLL